jgi:hypothetical protein
MVLPAWSCVPVLLPGLGLRIACDTLHKRKPHRSKDMAPRLSTDERAGSLARSFRTGIEKLDGIGFGWKDVRALDSSRSRSTAFFVQWRLMFDPVYLLSFVVLANCVLIDVKVST